MALSNFSEIKTSISSWLNRTGVFTDDQLNDFMRLAENRIYRVLRLPPMETTVSVASINNLISIPDDLLELIQIYYTDSNGNFVVLRPSAIDRVLSEANKTADPQWFRRIGASWRIAPSPESQPTFSIYYYRELEFLSDSNTDNWFTDYAPDLLFYAALHEASVFDRNEEDAVLYNQKFLNVLAEVEKLNKDATYTSSPLLTHSDMNIV